LGSISNIQKKKVVIQILVLKLINILIPDTVEAYESGELAKLLGIAVEDDDDLWTKALIMRDRQFIAE